MSIRTFLMTLASLMCMTIASADDSLFPRVEDFVKDRLAETTVIPEERQKELLKMSRYIVSCQSAGKTARLLFVCTHNSRRSQLAQVWAKIGATRFGLKGLESYSGGAEVTAMNRRTVAALEKVGLVISKADADSVNPKYSIVFSKAASPQICFSKRLTEYPNPTREFAAIMTCSSADESCPIVRGSELRLTLPYEDPKVSDDSPKESSADDEKCKEIAREMLFVMSRAAESK